MRQTLRSLFLCLSLLLGLIPSIASANPAPDYEVPKGHFYTQTNGSPLGTRGSGYAITDANDVPFWTFFSQNGGVDVLGYPVSQRFLWDGYVCQATQRSVLQWNQSTKQVQLANIYDYLSQVGKDDWLASAHLAPLPSKTPYESQPLSFLMLAHYRFAWLYTDPAIFRRYFDTPNYYTIYGLPTSPIVDLGPYYAERFQRAVLYHWKTKVPWADDRGTSIGLSGDLLKELGLIPAAALRPQNGPTPEPANGSLPATSSPQSIQLLTGTQASSQVTVSALVRADDLSHNAKPVANTAGSPAVVGVSTWYGADFQGRAMSNGRPYNMWNPRTAAANEFPLGTWLRVTRLTTGKSIVVQVTDHGAFTYPNVADLSYAAFAQLADPSVGVIGVKVEPVGAPN